MENPRNRNRLPADYEAKINLIAIWDWIMGRKRRKLREWLADNRKRRRQALHYKEPELTEAEFYDEMADRSDI